MICSEHLPPALPHAWTRSRELARGPGPSPQGPWESSGRLSARIVRREPLRHAARCSARTGLASARRRRESLTRAGARSDRGVRASVPTIGCRPGRRHLRPTGVLAIQNPSRDNPHEMLKRPHAPGVEIKMVTGHRIEIAGGSPATSGSADRSSSRPRSRRCGDSCRFVAGLDWLAECREVWSACPFRGSDHDRERTPHPAALSSPGRVLRAGPGGLGCPTSSLRPCSWLVRP